MILFGEPSGNGPTFRPYASIYSIVFKTPLSGLIPGRKSDRAKSAKLIPDGGILGVPLSREMIL
jgi:hypothetical protein